MILGDSFHFTHTLFLVCCGDIILSHKEDFPDLDIPGLQHPDSHWAPNSCHSVNELALSILLSSLQRPQYLQKGRMQAVGVVTHPEFFPASLLGSTTLEILLKSSEGCVLSSGMVKGEQ